MVKFDFAPVGFRFVPTEQEVLGYLRMKANGQEIPGKMISEQDFYADEDPWDIFGIENLEDEEEDEHYFFSCNKKKHANGRNLKRTGGGGTWKVQRKAKEIRDSRNKVIGFITPLSFIPNVNNPKGGKETRWVMHEYTLLDDAAAAKDCTLCKIRRINSKESISTTTTKCNPFISNAPSVESNIVPSFFESQHHQSTTNNHPQPSTIPQPTPSWDSDMYDPNMSMPQTHPANFNTSDSSSLVPSTPLQSTPSWESISDTSMPQSQPTTHFKPSDPCIPLSSLLASNPQKPWESDSDTTSMPQSQPTHFHPSDSSSFLPSDPIQPISSWESDMYYPDPNMFMHQTQPSHFSPSESSIPSSRFPSNPLQQTPSWEPYMYKPDMPMPQSQPTHFNPSYSSIPSSSLYPSNPLQPTLETSYSNLSEENDWMNYENLYGSPFQQDDLLSAMDTMDPSQVAYNGHNSFMPEQPMAYPSSPNVRESLQPATLQQATV